MNDLNAKLQIITARVRRACVEAARSADDVQILAVSKRQSADKIRQLHAAGQGAFGENYVQEALEKQRALQELTLEWHFIGPIQSNKTSEIATHFHWVHSADREKIVQRLSRQRPASLPPLNICIQVNIDREDQKSGALPEHIPELARLAASLPGLKLRGLMAIPRATADQTETKDSFHQVKALFDKLNSTGLELDTISMGMSADLEQAILCGSTMVRIGTDLFGPRK